MLSEEICSKVKDGENTKALPLLEELLRYGRKHSEIVILEGILNAEWYRALFELAVALYGKNIYAYYFDIPFRGDREAPQNKAELQ